MVTGPGVRVGLGGCGNQALATELRLVGCYGNQALATELRLGVCYGNQALATKLPRLDGCVASHAPIFVFASKQISRKASFPENPFTVKSKVSLGLLLNLIQNKRGPVGPPLSELEI